MRASLAARTRTLTAPGATQPRAATRPAPMSRESPRAVSRTAATTTPPRPAVGERAARPGPRRRRARGVPAVIEHRGGDLRLAHDGLLVLDARRPSSSRTVGERQTQPLGSVTVRPVSGARSRAPGAARSSSLEVGHDRLAQRARVPGDRRTDLQDLDRVVRPEHVMDDQHRSSPWSTPTRTASPTREARESAHSSDRPRSSWLSRKAFPSCSMAGPSRYLPVSGSCSTSSWDSRVRRSPYDGSLGQAEPLGDLGDAHP